MDRIGSRSVGGEIAASINKRCGNTLLLQNTDGAIDGKAFGNPAEVDQRIRRVKANMVVGKKLYPRC